MANRVALESFSKIGTIQGEYLALSGKDSSGQELEVVLSAKHLAAIMPTIQKALNDVTKAPEGHFNATALLYQPEASGHALLNFQFAQASEIRVRIPPDGVQHLKIALCGSGSDTTTTAN
jgi:hypothetical protein